MPATNPWKEYVKKNLMPIALRLDKLVTTNLSIDIILDGQKKRPVTLSTAVHAALKNYCTSDKAEDYAKGFIPFSKAVSPLKFLNPLKVIAALSTFIQFSVSLGIDTLIPSKHYEPRFHEIIDSSSSKSLPRVLKAILISPFIALSLLVEPLANVEKIPPVARLATRFSNFLKEKFSSEKSQPEAPSVTHKEPNINDNTPQVKAETKVNTETKAKINHSSTYLYFNKFSSGVKNAIDKFQHTFAPPEKSKKTEMIPLKPMSTNITDKNDKEMDKVDRAESESKMKHRH